MARALRRVIYQIDPAVPVMGVTTIDRIISESVAGRRFYTATVAAFAMLALVLTASGLIVVIARSVAERRHELAVRSALGARNGQLVSLVVRQGLRPVICGTAAGLLGAWWGARVLEQFLFEVKLHEPAVYCAAGLFTVMVAALGCFLPARSISRLAPSVSLKSE
jgi:ABC-type antimicrobial peptide transport system permease subunit